MGTAFDFFKNELGDDFSNNLLVNGEAEPGVLTGWLDYNGASTVVGGVGIYGDYVFKLPTGGGRLLQTVSLTYNSNTVQIFGFFYTVDHLVANLNSEVYLALVLSYHEELTFDVHRLIVNAALTDEYAGNYFDPGQVDVNYYLAKGEFPTREGRTLKDATVIIHNDGDVDMYCDNIGLRLGIGIGATVSAYTSEPMIDKYGVDSRYLQYAKNLVSNSSFEIFHPTTLAAIGWTGGVVSANTFFTGSYSLLLAAAEDTVQEASVYINPTLYGNKFSRVSFNHRDADIEAAVYDVTNAQYFTLVVQEGTTDADATPLTGTDYINFLATDSTPLSSWVDSRRSFSFDPTEFGACTAVRLEFTNIDTVDGYIDDVMLTPDFTGKWPTLYEKGPVSDPAYIVSASDASELKIWHGTEAAYAAIVTKQAKTIYVCTAT